MSAPPPAYFSLPLQVSADAWDTLGLRDLPLTRASYRTDLQQLARQLRRLGHERASASRLGLLGLLNRVFRHLLQTALPGEATLPGVIGYTFVDRFPPHPRSRIEEMTRWRSGTPATSRLLLAELLILAVQNGNPAARDLVLLHDDRSLQAECGYRQFLQEVAGDLDPNGSRSASLLEQLAVPLRAAPDSLAAQLTWVASHWRHLLPEELLEGIPLAIAVWLEEQQFRGGGPGPLEAGRFHAGDGEPEAFSIDADWMPDVVLQAKSCHVWLDQLSRRHGCTVERLDQIPDSELQRLAASGINALWLIGLWERSTASGRLKQLNGNREALASAYSLYDYRIAADLGGEESFRQLQRRAARYGVRLCGDVVPNHTGLYSRWIKEHPDRFIQLDQPPYIDYRFTGPELSPDPELSLKIDDGYWNHSNAAVVFRHQDRRSGRVRFIYHGNDGTHLPWNDTAQLDYLNPEVREEMIRTIVEVARRFPIIRFDAAMTLAKKHFQRLWYPLPGGGAGVPSRAEYPLDQAEFDRRFPVEFWREVVDRVAAEAPGTLLVAEAFWLMEGFFVRTLGMHRVYNSAFMNMLKSEENGKFRQTLKNVLAFNPEILQRFVNFMNNPDEATAVAQFGKGDKYFGVATLLATLPGLPLIGHGQLEGLEEKYGMEYRRPRHDEPVDEGFRRHHEALIFPLLRRRRLFSGAEHFWLLDFETGDGTAEDVIAFANRDRGRHALVVVHNRHATLHGRLRRSAPRRVGGESGPLQQVGLLDALGLPSGDRRLYALRRLQDGRWQLHHSRSLEQNGLELSLGPYAHLVFPEIRTIEDASGDWQRLCELLDGRAVADLDQELIALRHAPLHHALHRLLTAQDAAAARAWFSAWLAASGHLPDHIPDLTERWLQLADRVDPGLAEDARIWLLAGAALLFPLGHSEGMAEAFGRFGLALPLRSHLPPLELDLLREFHRLVPQPRELTASRYWLRLLADGTILGLLGHHAWEGEEYLRHEALQRLVSLAPLALALIMQVRRLPLAAEDLEQSGSFLLQRGMETNDRLARLRETAFPSPLPRPRRKRAKLKVLFVASEVVPFAKSGGLADVAGALPLALHRLGVDVRIVMPYYRSVAAGGVTLRQLRHRVAVDKSELAGEASVYQGDLGGVPVYLLDFPPAFDRAGLYGEGGRDYPDNDLRFAWFARGALELARRIDFRPDLVHVHDWQTALLPVLLRSEYARDPFFAATASLLTIHNLGYQGLFPGEQRGRLALPPGLFDPEGLEYFGQLTFLKGGILFADRLTTVSPGYAGEILTPEFGRGFEAILATRRDALHGILNGLDTGYWDPAVDPHLPARFTPQNLRGKTAVKRRLQQELGLEETAATPLAVMVTRLDPQKGVDLVLNRWDDLLQRDLQLVILGSGDPALERQLREFCAATPDRTRFIDGFNEPLAHRLYGGADLFLMPSRYEPCGLSQLIALRYGAVPVVRRTGGLADTVFDSDEDPRNGNGFVFGPASADALLAAVDRALDRFKLRRSWLSLMRRGMLADSSWERSAAAYLNLYRQTVENQHD